MVDILTKTSANEAMMKQEELEEEFEDGELIEEGEICDDHDEPEQTPGQHQPPTAASSPPSNGHSASSPHDKKRSREELMAPKNTGAESPWKPQQQQQHQDDGFGFGDRDFRSMGTAEDRDFRWIEGPANGAGAESDFDFRDRKRRRHSPSPPPHLKRARLSPPHGPFADEGPPYIGGRGGTFGGRGGFRGRGRGGGFGGPRWMEPRHICKFFREGYCRDGDNCTYSHSAEDSKRRPEVCKFYLSGHCKKGLACHHLHGEFPCKAFHKGECTRDPCQFSHLPLNDYTRPMFDQLMRDEQLSTRITMPLAPVRRRVLLPGGPCAPLLPPPGAVAAAQAAAAVVTQGLVAPPGVTPGPFPPGYVPQTGGMGQQSAALFPPSVVVPKLSQPAARAASPPTPPVSAASAAATSGGAAGFSISMILAQIAGTMQPGGASDNEPSSPPELESPESPPQSPHDSFHSHAGKMGGAMTVDIPLSYKRDVVEYRQCLVDSSAPYSGVSSAIFNSASQQSDPRVARMLRSQLDAVSSMEQAASAASPPSVSAVTAPVAAPPMHPRRPADPRAARADPRRDPRTARAPICSRPC